MKTQIINNVIKVLQCMHAVLYVYTMHRTLLSYIYIHVSHVYVYLYIYLHE